MKKELCVVLYTYSAKETQGSVDSYLYAYLFRKVYS